MPTGEEMEDVQIEGRTAFFERFVDAHKRMTAEEIAALEEWEKENLGDGKLATSDWPGWAGVLARLQH